MRHVTPLSAIDRLTEAIQHLRVRLDRTLAVVERAHNFYAIAVAVRDLASADVVVDDLTSLARDSGLMADLDGGAEDVAHLILSALRDRNGSGERNISVPGQQSPFADDPERRFQEARERVNGKGEQQTNHVEHWGAADSSLLDDRRGA